MKGKKKKKRQENNPLLGAMVEFKVVQKERGKKDLSVDSSCTLLHLGSPDVAIE